jgi:electron transfer flavoprotein beta subunit
MKIAVAIKQVPDTEARLRVAKDGRWIEEEDQPFVMNPNDEFALEEALRLAEATSGEVVVFGLGGERVREGLRKALALGASRAVWLSSPAFWGGDAIANARALAAAMGQEPFELVLTGSQSADLGFGATGTLLAAALDWPHAWLVMGVTPEGNGTVRVVREMESGWNELLRLRLPAVLSVQAGINHPRYASLKGIMAAKKKEIREVTPEALGLAPNLVGFSGSLTEILDVAPPESQQGGQLVTETAEVAATILVDFLEREARVTGS